MSRAFAFRVCDQEIVVNTPTREALLDLVRSRFREGSGFAIATLNLDHLVQLRSSAAFRQAYRSQDFVVADGNPVVWLSRLARRPVSLVAGSDLVEPLVALAAREGVPVALLGSAPETLERAAFYLSSRIPALEVAARLAPGFGFDPHGVEAGEMIEKLRRSGAGLTLIALGAPRQEMFAARCREALPDMGFASIGAGLDFLASSQRRAPRWMRRLALEWLWRVATSPSRLAGRYTRCAMALPGLVGAAIAEALRPAPAGLEAAGIANATPQHPHRERGATDPR